MIPPARAGHESGNRSPYRPLAPVGGGELNEGRLADRRIGHCRPAYFGFTQVKYQSQGGSSFG